MDLLQSLMNGLGKQNFLNLSFIRELNSNVKLQLNIIHSQYNRDGNKYNLIQELVKYGFRLETLVKSKGEEILDLQMSFFSGLLNPIIFKIKEVCFYLLNELVDDIKNIIDKYLEVFDDINTIMSTDNRSKILYTKCSKFINTSMSICVPVFGKQYQMTKLSETSFNEFGIVIKITNPNLKNQLKPLFELLGLFVLPDKTDAFANKKFDWVWKINQLNNLSVNFSIEKNLILLKDKISQIQAQEQFYENLDSFFSDIKQTFWQPVYIQENISGKFVSGEIVSNEFVSNELVSNELTSNEFVANELVSDDFKSDKLDYNSKNEISNIVRPIELEYVDQMENFQIIQSIEQSNNTYGKDMCIELIDNTSNIEQITNQNKSSGKKKNRNKNINDNIDSKSNIHDKISKNLNVIEDQSFVLPIAN